MSNSTTTKEALERLRNIKGVAQYIILEGNGRVICQDMNNYLMYAPMITSCLNICKTIDTHRFRYLVFAQKNHEDFIVLPLGKYLLGVVKEANLSSAQLILNIDNFRGSLKL